MGGRPLRYRPRLVLAATLVAAAAVPLAAATSGPPAAATGPTTRLVAAGSNDQGQLGAGVVGGESTSPVAVGLPPGVGVVATTGSAGDGYALGTDGSVYAWGADDLGQLGDGTAGPSTATPVAVPLPPGVTVTAVAATEDDGFALTSAGTLYAWGTDQDGELGDGTVGGTIRDPAPVPLPAGTAVAQVACAEHTVYALTTAGTVYDWGGDAEGELAGPWPQSASGAPTPVALPGGVAVTTVAAGQFDAYAIAAGGVLYAWGENLNGQAGAGTASIQNTPLAVSLAPGVTAVAVAGGGFDGYAIGSDHTLYAWGSNVEGQLGIASTSTSETRTPVPVTLAPGVTPTSVAASAVATYALGSDGQLYGWGDNEVGQQFTSGPIDRFSPTPMPLPPGAAAAGLDPQPNADATYLVIDPGTTLVAGAQPASLTAFAGDTVTFTATTTGTAFPTVQWQVSTDHGATYTPVAGADTDTLTLADLTTGQNGDRYEAVFSADGGTVTSNPAVLTVFPPTPPIVVTQPAGQTVAAGLPVSFTAAAISLTGAQDVQWQVSTDGGATYVPVPGATTGTLTLPDPIPADNGSRYEAVFTNRFGSSATDPATLTVVAGAVPLVTAQPADVTLYPAQTATFAAAASGAPTPTVQWQLSTDHGATWVDVPGLTSTSFTSGLADLVESGWEVRAVFTNELGTAVSAPATATVTTAGGSAPVVTVEPQSQTLPVGQPITFTADADGVPTPTVQWQLSTTGGASWIDLPGVTSTTLFSAQLFPEENGWEVRAVFSNFAGTAVTAAAVVTVT